MKAHEEDYIKRWEDKYGQGKWFYLITTSLVWGTILSFAYRILNMLINKAFSFEAFTRFFTEWRHIANWMKWVCFIFIVSFSLWLAANSKYRQLKKKQCEEQRHRATDGGGNRS